MDLIFFYLQAELITIATCFTFLFQKPYFNKKYWLSKLKFTTFLNVLQKSIQKHFLLF